MNKNDKRNILAGLYGNALEWYDFLLYASFAPIFAQIFFPAHIYFTSLLATFGVFAVGFLIRPIGGLVMGHYSDVAGRRKALILSIIIMTFSTLFAALLPTYQTAGILAPILFTLLRLIQGFAVGGELPGSATFLIEHMFANRKGFAGSLILSTAFLGIFAGSLTATGLTSFLPKDISLFSWRIAYLIGGLLGVIGIYLRIKSNESPEFLERKLTQELPAKIIFLNYKRSLFIAVLLTSILAIGNYILIAFMTTFLVDINTFALKDALTINFAALFILTLLIPIMGFLSDIIGINRILLIGLISLIAFIFPIFFLLSSGNFLNALMSEILLSVILSPLNATVPTAIAEMFPCSVRGSGISIGYNIGQAAFGGTVPIVAFTLIKLTGNPISPAWYTFACALVVFTIYLGVKKHISVKP